MNDLHFLFYRRGKAILLALIFSILYSLSFAQITNRVRDVRAIRENAVGVKVLQSDTTPINRAIINKEIRINPGISDVFIQHPATDTVWDASPFLQSKEGCAFEKSVDTGGCVIVKYSDGLIKKVCNGNVTEVITPDGKKHVIRVMTVKMYVMKIPPPPNPQQADTTYQWITGYNDALLNDIKFFLGGSDKALNDYQKREDSKTGSNIYKKIEYRTIFIEEFLKAK